MSSSTSADYPSESQFDTPAGGAYAWAGGNPISGASSVAVSTSLHCCCGSPPCVPEEWECEEDECKLNGCCVCVPASTPMWVDIETCCGEFSGNVTMTNGDSGCVYTGSFLLCESTVTITVDPNACTVTIGGGCIPTKSASIESCDCNGVQWTVEWSEEELEDCPGCEPVGSGP